MIRKIYIGAHIKRDERGIIETMNNIKNNVYSPREYYLNNHGLKTSGKQLRDFLKSINPDLNDCKYVRFEISSG